MTSKKSGPKFGALIVLLFFVGGYICACKSRNAPHEIRVIAIATLMQHPALDQVQANLFDQLRSDGWIDGKTAHIIVRNANGQQQLVGSMIDELASRNPDVLVAITSPVAQAAARVSKAPVVFAAVTDPVGSGLVQSLDTPRPNITGTSDAWPYPAQLKLIHSISPQAKKIGVVFNPGEAPGRYAIEQLHKHAAEYGFEIVEAAANSTNDVYPAAESLASKVDVLLLPSDNTAIAGCAAALRVAVAHRMPLYAGDSGTVKTCALASVSVGYAELGTETGRLVNRVLHGETNITVVVESGGEIYINRRAAQLMHVEIPQEILSKATKVYDSLEQ